jgi:hypothetical protein
VEADAVKREMGFLRRFAAGRAREVFNRRGCPVLSGGFVRLKGNLEGGIWIE